MWRAARFLKFPPVAVTANASALRAVSRQLRTTVGCLCVSTITLALTLPATAQVRCEPHWDTHVGHPGTNGWVYALTVFDDGSGSGPALYAGGRFTLASGLPAHYIARWDLATWWPVGSGMGEVGGVTVVRALAVFDDGTGGGPALYAGGSFITAGDVEVSNIAKWDGTTWSAVGGGLADSASSQVVTALIVHDDGSGGGAALYAGGHFTTAGGEAAHSVAKWDGTSWSPLGSGLNGPVDEFAILDDGSGRSPLLVVCGDFSLAGGIEANSIAAWDGSAWSTLGAGMNGPVTGLGLFDDGSGGGPALYAGGNFTSAGGVSATRVAKWNAKSGEWSAVGAGMDGSDFNLPTVHAFAEFDDGSGSALFAVGHFTTADGIVANSIARWDGRAQSWSPIGGGISAWGFTASVSSLAVFDDGLGSGPSLFIGGYYNTVDDLPSYFMTTWRGCIVSDVPSSSDLDDDGIVAFSDLLILLAAWGECGEPCAADLDESGDVGFGDLLLMLANWS